MLDFAALRAKSAYVLRNVAARKSKGNVAGVLQLHAAYVEVRHAVDTLRRDRNMVASSTSISAAEKQAAGKRIKEELAALEARLAGALTVLNAAAQRLPSDTHPDAPVGAESAARTIYNLGSPRQFDFSPKDHVALGTDLGLFNLKAASAITGSSFALLTGDGAMLELALVQWALSEATRAGFLAVLPPDLAQASLVAGCGFDPRDEGEEEAGGDAGEGAGAAAPSGGMSQVYRLRDSDLCLIGTSEIPLAGLHAGELLRPESLPKAYAAFSHCFRREAGGAGSATRGLYRLHQFSKVELFGYVAPGQALPPASPLAVDRVQRTALVDALVYKGGAGAEGAAPDPVSDGGLAALVDFQVGLLSSLGLSARVLDMPTEELGAAAYRKVDCEAWMPGRGAGGSYGEVTSASNCQDFQARRLNIRYRAAQGDNRFVHTLNATALAVPRIILALLETHQARDGSVALPPCLVPFMGGRAILTPTHGR
jgi:seryl-tRNA synthetase